MKRLITLFTVLFSLFTVVQAQIEIDGDMLDWAGIPTLDQAPIEETIGDIVNPAYSDFDIKHIYVTHDSDYVYVRIDINDAGSFDNFYNFDNPPVFEFYLDTEIGDTTGFDWGWWNNAYNYYINLAPTLHPDSTEIYAELYIYRGGRIPTWAEGEFELVEYLDMAINDDRNALEFAIPRELVNFGNEFRPWVYSVGNYEWGDGADQCPTEGGDFMLKYDFAAGGSVVQCHGDEPETAIEIDGDLLDWAAVPQADVDEIAEDVGDMPTGPEFDLKDIYVASDSNNFYMRIDIDPAGTFSGIYTNYDNESAFQIFFDVDFGATTGLGYEGFWTLPVDYMVDLSAALHPDSLNNTIPIYRYIADWAGAYEEFAEVPGAFATFAKNDEDNALEIAIPRAAINAGTNIHPWVYVVGDDNWDNEEYFPNTVMQGWSDDFPPVYYALDYYFMTGNEIAEFGESYTVVGVEDFTDGNAEVVEGYGLVMNYPNPFNPSTTIKFNVPSRQAISIYVYDVLGRKVATLMDKKELAAGEQKVQWNANVSTSGIYFYQIVGESGIVTKKMTLLK